jgi:dolichyl-phosphate beta-glucosyltransferase
MSTALRSQAGLESTYSDPSLPGGIRAPFPSLFSPATIDLSVIVPAYNESARLPAMLDETLAFLCARAEESPGFSFEVIIVDDGSSDSTAEVAHSYTQRYSAERVRLLRLVTNVGKGGAVRRGMLAARGERLLMADADAATVFADLEKLEHGMKVADVAVGSRTHLKGRGAAEGRSALRGFISTVFNFFVMFVAGVKGIRDTQCGFKLYTREAARVAFDGQQLKRWAFDVENLYRVQQNGMRVVEVPVQWTEVPGSKLSVVKATINMILDMLRMRICYSAGTWTVGNGLTAGRLSPISPQIARI